MTNDTVTIEIETVSTCIGLTARFWKVTPWGEHLEGETDLKHTVNGMHRLKEQYGKCGLAVVFTVR